MTVPRFFARNDGLRMRRFVLRLRFDLVSSCFTQRAPLTRPAALNSSSAQDPPAPTRLRGLVVKAFTARRVEDMRPRIQHIVDETLDAIAGQGHMDLIEDFAFRLPVTIICDMLGIPEDHREVFYKSSRDGGRLLHPVQLSQAEIEQANASNIMAQMYFQQLFELRRKNPGDDLTTQLVQAEEEGSKLSNEALTAHIILLFVAGQQTTPNLIGNGLLAVH